MDSTATVPVAAAVRRDDEFWFPNGDLLLLAGNVEFRIYKDLLVSHSPVFGDMLSLPQSSHDRVASKDPDLNSAIPAVVHLTDSPEDLRHFLRLFAAGKTIRIGAIYPTFHQISACIRLGHKYQVDQVVQQGIEYLKRHYSAEARVWFSTTSVEPPHFERIHVIGVVNLARLTGTHTMLPTALMSCSMLGSEIVDGFVREDGSRETLAPDDLGRCFVGKGKLVQENMSAMHNVFCTDVAADCKRPVKCKPVLIRLLDGVLKNDEWLRPRYWYECWRAYVDRVDEDRKLCWKCYKMVTETRKEEQEHRIFRELPAMMGVEVEGWAADLIKKERRKAG